MDTILLDNMTLDDLRRAVALAKGRAVLEASGNVTLSRRCAPSPRPAWITSAQAPSPTAPTWKSDSIVAPGLLCCIGSTLSQRDDADSTPRTIEDVVADLGGLFHGIGPVRADTETAWKLVAPPVAFFSRSEPVRIRPPALRIAPGASLLGRAHVAIAGEGELAAAAGRAPS